MILNNYPTEVIASWRTSRLGCLYMNACIAGRHSPDDAAVRNRVIGVLATRPILERLALYDTLQREYERVLRGEWYEHAAHVHDMLDRFRMSIL